MILIISSIDDQSTNDVIDWLRFYKISFLRIAQTDLLWYQTLQVSNDLFEVSFSIGERCYKLSDFSAFWYRRGHIGMAFEGLTPKTTLAQQINNHLFTEAREIHKIVRKTMWEQSLNKEEDIYLNKLELLKLAVATGIKIPDTLITDRKSEALAFAAKHTGVITKNFSPGIFIKDKGRMLGNSTQLVDQEMIKDLPDHFYYTLFQEMIDKLFELRIFFIDGTFYASAIFSQNNEQTKIDFRNYDHRKPNRTPPFQLPPDIAAKLNLLMEKAGINCGSIDMMVSDKNEYIFLEVNPIGQFAQVSIPCNYKIEKKVAEQLITIANGAR
jgi:ATP-GRASP peptide maturase of grasp-with-spasm system